MIINAFAKMIPAIMLGLALTVTTASCQSAPTAAPTPTAQLLPSPFMPEATSPAAMAKAGFHIGGWS